MKPKLTNILELLITIALSLSLFIVVEDDESAFAALFFSIILFSVTFIEWKRRKTSDPNETFFIKYIYMLFMFFVFIMGVWFVNQVNTHS
jgi:hypothetical protein